MEKTIRQIASQLQAIFLENGIIVQRYNAYKTNSIYLKLDYGVLNSIRISDHPGKQYLSYRYNIGPHIQEYTETINKYPMYFYPIEQQQELINTILQIREEKINKYTPEKYKAIMQGFLENSQHNKGFWEKAKTYYPILDFSSVMLHTKSKTPRK